jgi:hypothetical protein
MDYELFSLYSYKGYFSQHTHSLIFMLMLQKRMYLVHMDSSCT